MKLNFLLNHSLCELELPPGKVVLDVIRRDTGLKGTKEGCREGDCGACTVLLGKLDPQGSAPCVRYGAVASCLLPAAELAGCHLVTIEGLNGEGLSPIQQAFVDEGATQCGFCTPGFIVALTGFLLAAPAITMEEALAAVEGQICRCTGYAAIRRALEKIVDAFANMPLDHAKRIPWLVGAGVLPEHFLRAAQLLESIEPAPVSREGVVIAGGTDLFVQKADQLRDTELQLLSRRPDLHLIEEHNQHLSLGAAVTAEELLRSQLVLSAYPGLLQQLRLISSQLIRRRASIGGNLVNASPIGDLSIMLLALGGRLLLEQGDTKRELPLEDFFLGYKQLDLQPGELIHSVSVPLPDESTFFNFEKVSQRKHLDIAAVNSALWLQLDGDVIQHCRISAGGVAPVPLLLRKTSAALCGRSLCEALVAEAVESACAEVSPIDDVRGSAEYKRDLLGRLVCAHFEKLFSRRGEEA